MPARDKRALGLAVMGQRLAVVVPYFKLDPKDRTALVLALLMLLGLGQVSMFRQRFVDAAHRRHFGHAPSMDRLNAVDFAERFDHRGRTGGAADNRAFKACQSAARLLGRAQQPEPDRRHPKGQRHTVLIDQPCKRSAVKVRPRQYHARAYHGAGIGAAPSIDVEHRHHGQDDIAR